MDRAERLNYANLAIAATKMGLAVLLSLLLARAVVPKDVLSAAFVAMISIQPALVTGIKRGIEQLGASLLGVAVTGLVLWSVGDVLPTLVLSTMVTVFLVMRWRWEISAQVVALFTILYMGLLPQDTPLATALLRVESVLLGVGVGLAVNFSFSFISYRILLEGRLEMAIELVQETIFRVLHGIRTADQGMLDRELVSFRQTFRQLSDLRDEVADLCREFRIQRPGGISRDRLATFERITRHLELATHYTQDVVLLAREVVSVEDLKGLEPALDSIEESTLRLGALLAGQPLPTPHHEALPDRVSARNIPLPQVGILADLKQLEAQVATLERLIARYVSGV